MRALTGLALFLLTLLSLAKAATVSTVEDWNWTAHPIGSAGVPAGWTAESFGRRAFYDLTVEAAGDVRALHLKSRDEHSTISKDIGGKVALRDTPILEWTGKVAILPVGGDLRQAETSDLPIQLYVVWSRFPDMLRSRVVGYGWDASAPVGFVAPSRKTARVTFVVLRTGSADLGRWVMERRNVAHDYRRIFGEAPDDPRVITISIDSNDTHSSAEAFVGADPVRRRLTADGPMGALDRQQPRQACGPAQPRRSARNPGAGDGSTLRQQAVLFSRREAPRLGRLQDRALSPG